MPNKPASMPQRAPRAVMPRFQMLSNPTGPQLEANTVPMNRVIQNTLGGMTRLSPSTTTLTPAMARRVILRPPAPLPGLRSWLTLKPTRDRNVEAEDSAAAMIPATSSAPSTGGTNWVAAQISTVSGGSIAGLARLITPPTP